MREVTLPPAAAEPGADVLAPVRPAHAAAALVLFACLAIFHTWPLAGAPATHSRHDIADALLNEWAVAWVAHQIVSDPRHLFDANIFYPEPNTLAFSEHLFVQSLLGAPLLWAGAPTLLVHNLLVLAGFALTGWAMALVVRRWTGDWWAAILAGMLLAFNAHSLSRIAHLQAVHVEFLPLAVYALDRLLTRPSVKRAFWLSLAFVAQSLTSNYFLVFVTFGLLGSALARVREWFWTGKARVFALLLLSGAVAILLLAPFLLHYLEAQREQGLTRTLDEVSKYAASWEDYLAASGRLHFELWSARFWRGAGAPLFPGVTALGLTVVAVLSGAAWRRRGRMWLAMGVMGLTLSFGTSLPGYDTLYYVVPLLQGIRASVRFGYLLLAAIAALAAFGLVVVRARTVDRPGLRTAISAAALLLVTVEAARIPVAYTVGHRTPGVYRVIADAPDAVLVELPLYSPSAFFRNGAYMLHSAEHWRPILNGYSGFIPRIYQKHFDELRVFPDASALKYLRDLNVTHVAVHANWFAEVRGEERLQRIRSTPGLRPLVHAGNLTIYLLEPERQ